MGKRRCRWLGNCLVWFVTSIGALIYSVSCINAVEIDRANLQNGPQTFSTVGAGGATDSFSNDHINSGSGKKGPGVEQPTSCPAKVPDSVKNRYAHIFVDRVAI